MPLNTSINTPYLVLTGVVLIAIVFIFTVIQPQLDTISTLRHDITDNTNTLKTKQDFLDSLALKVQQLQAQPDAEKQLAVVVPQGDMTQDILRVVNQYATQMGVAVTAVKNNSEERQAQLDASAARGDASVAPSDVRTLSFEVDASGSYPQMRDFLKTLEKSPRIIDVTHITMKTNQ
ncbi:MAG TPA: hypothetical protein VLG69_00675, partial [Candidatus Andersenbacteria bacterium]|nr:hypothetical protein [Candidatus Andersenbacteria bacterium]